jgi:hypothetical protein
MLLRFSLCCLAVRCPLSKYLMVALSLCSVACDGGFHARGMIFAQDRTSLSNCTIALTGPPSALMCCDTKLSPPKVDVHFTVAPSNIAYKLVLACAGFQPEERVFNGEDASPSKPLELGVIILRHSVARLRDFSVTEQAAIAKQYDPSSLVEVTSIANLPNDLKAHFKGWLGQRRENIAPPSEDDDPGDSSGRFTIAGVSDSSALVAYELYGYVPTTHATAYVHVKSDWIAARKWDNVGYPQTLRELQVSIEQLSTPVSGH